MSEQAPPNDGPPTSPSEALPVERDAPHSSSEPHRHLAIHSGHLHHPEFPLKLKLLEKIKQRNVGRVAVLYIITSYLVLEVFELFFHLLEMPAWAGRAIVLLVVLGFPAALILAWIYELTPEGIKYSDEVNPKESITRQTGRKLDKAIIAILCVVVIYFAADKFWLSKRSSELAETLNEHEGNGARHAEGRSTASAVSSTEAPSPILQPVSNKSIAVLPFVDMSERRDQEYFSDGLTEELIDKLANAEDLKVIARTSSFAFKGKNEDIRSIAQKLGVANLLEGSVRRSGAVMRVTVQLIRASDGTHMFSKTYDRPVADVFKVQDAISAAVFASLEAVLINANLQTSSESNSDVHDLILKGNYFFNRGRTGDTQKSIDVYQQATALAPGSAEAWARLGYGYILLAMSGRVVASESRDKAFQAIQKALRLDPNYGFAHRALGKLYFALDYDWPQAVHELRAATRLGLPPPYDSYNEENLVDIEANATGDYHRYVRLEQRDTENDPLDVRSWQEYAWALAWADDLQTALSTLQHAITIDPQYQGIHSQEAWMLHFLHRDAEALTASEKEPDPDRKIYNRTVFPWLVGQHEAADIVLTEYIKKQAKVDPGGIAEAYAIRGDTDRALDWLERAISEHQYVILGLRWHPLWKPINNNPRFQALLHKLKLDVPLQ